MLKWPLKSSSSKFRWDCFYLPIPHVFLLNLCEVHEYKCMLECKHHFVCFVPCFISSICNSAWHIVYIICVLLLHKSYPRWRFYDGLALKTRNPQSNSYNIDFANWQYISYKYLTEVYCLTWVIFSIVLNQLPICKNWDFISKSWHQRFLPSQKMSPHWVLCHRARWAEAA